MPRKRVPDENRRVNKRRKLFADARFVLTEPCQLPEEDLMLPIATMMDLSKYGTMLKISPGPEADKIEKADFESKRLFLRFVLKDTLVEIHEKVVWFRRGPENQLFLGLSHDDPSEELRHLLIKLIFSTPSVDFGKMRKRAVRHEMTRRGMAYFVAPVTATFLLFMAIVGVNTYFDHQKSGIGIGDAGQFLENFEGQDVNAARLFVTKQGESKNLPPEVVERILQNLNPEDPETQKKMEKVMEYRKHIFR